MAFKETVLVSKHLSDETHNITCLLDSKYTTTRNSLNKTLLSKIVERGGCEVAVKISLAIQRI